MNRERWTSFSAATAEERALLAALDGVSARRAFAIVGPDGRETAVPATLSVEAAEPFDGKADVVVRLTFDGDGPGEGARIVGDAWALLDRFLRETEAEARRRAAGAR